LNVSAIAPRFITWSGFNVEINSLIEDAAEARAGVRECFVRIAVQGLSSEIEKGFLPVPNCGVEGGHDDPPRSIWKDEGGELQINAHEPITGEVADVLPVFSFWTSPRAIIILAEGFPIAGEWA
jgi:hypothetical protein